MLSFKTSGKGEAILLIHGFGISYPIWRKLLPHLGRYFQIIIVELPGVGRSVLKSEKKSYVNLCCREIDKLRTHLHITKWNVVSYSLGTRIAEAYIQKYPANIIKSVFIFPAIMDKSRLAILKTYLLIDNKLPSLGDWLLKEWRLLLWIVIIGFNGKKTKESEFWHKILKRQNIQNLKLFLRDVPALAGENFNIKGKKTLFVWGKKDWAVKRKKELFTFVNINSRHDGIITHAGEISELIKLFLKDNKKAGKNSNYMPKNNLIL